MESRKNKIVIDKISDLVKKYNLSPTKFRYVCGQVRIKCNLVIEKRARRLPEYLNPAEIYHLLEISMKDDLDGLLIEFLIFTGLRISEARNLLIQDIDFSNNNLKVVQGKGKKDRFVLLTNNLIHKIKLYLNKRSRGYLFCKPNNKPYTIRALQQRVKNRINECNFNKSLSTHSLRHTFACLCLSKGLRLEDIQLLMGHDSIKTTEIYAKLELSSIKQKFLQIMDRKG